MLALAGITCGVFIAYSGYRAMGGGPVSDTAALLRNVAASTLLGAAVGYAAAYYFFQPLMDHRPPMESGH